MLEPGALLRLFWLFCFTGLVFARSLSLGELFERLPSTTFAIASGTHLERVDRMDFPERNALRVFAIGLAILARTMAAVTQLLAGNAHAKSLVSDIIDVTGRPFAGTMVRNDFRTHSIALIV